ncbi:IBR domain protein [Rhizoctonia solani]|uniref:RBR-type E3 ubiquitin transferase n=1 Tax=Rhizoctonia solani TaxID=456999 RepID=A0A8H8SSA7_9AGAM|nr:IBR domain protein [Rhizoctonia solani]QRW15794.1 IBR domain protein [Rhizoctonia solani]
MQSAYSGFGGLSQTSVPALGFARVASGSTVSRQQMAPSPFNGPSGSRSYGQDSYRVPATQATNPPPSNRPPYSTFATSSRNESHNTPRPFREDSGWAPSLSDAGPPVNPFTTASTSVSPKAARRPEPTAPYGANTYGSPLDIRTKTPNAQIAAAQAARNLYAHRSSPPGSLPAGSSDSILRPSNIFSLSPQPHPLPLNVLRRHSPEWQPSQNFSRGSAGTSDYQGMVIDSSGDYYPRHDGRIASIPTQPLIIPVSDLTPIDVNPAASNTTGEIQMCVVCFEQGSDVRFAARSPTASCHHGATVCVSCLEQHILIAIHKSRSVGIRCPHDGCGKMLEYQDVYCSVRDWSMLAYYEQLLIRREMGNTEQFVWCKNPICTSGQVHKPGPNQPIVTCNTCHQKSCYVHDRPWHEGLSCEDFDIKLRRYEEQDRATRAYLAKNTKSCPKCKRKIERNGGCDHMTCQRPGGCGHEFCWECLADGGSHKPGCSHLPSRIRRRCITVRRP